MLNTLVMGMVWRNQNATTDLSLCHVVWLDPNDFKMGMIFDLSGRFHAESPANGAGREDKGNKGWLWGDIKLDDDENHSWYSG